MKTKVKQNQSLLDLALEHGGDITSSFDLAQKNDIQVDEWVQPGIEIDSPEKINSEVVEQFKLLDSPATSALVPGEVIVPEPPVPPIAPDAWVRNPEWLEIDELDGTEQKFVGILAIFSNSENKQTFRVSAPSGYTVNWGDGNIINYGSNVFATHYYDFNTIPSSTETSAGYRQVKITVTPIVSTETFNYLFYWRYNNTSNWLDCNAYIPNVTLISQVGTAPYLERFRFSVTTPSCSLTNVFSYCTYLQVLEIDWTKPTLVSNAMMYSSIKDYGDIYLQNSTSVTLFGARNTGLRSIGTLRYDGATVGALAQISGLETIGDIYLPNANSLYQMFLEAHNLKGHVGIVAPNALTAYMCFRNANKVKSIYIDAPLLTNLTQFIYVTHSVEEVIFTNCSNVTTTANFVGAGTYTLRKIRLPGLPVTVSLAQTNIDAPAMVDLFNDLADLTALPTQTITISTTPASINLTAAERLIATSKNWTIVG